MAKKITIPYNGKTYTLQFNRDIASSMEKQGFDIHQLTDKPASMIPMLFHGAFLLNHPNTKGATKEKIYDNLRCRTKLVQTLGEMYIDAYNTLFDDEDDVDDEGNPGWGMVE